MKHFIFILTLLTSTVGWTQDKYWVQFSDKDGVEFDPLTYFDAKAIQRRVKHNLPLVEETDKPLREDYYNAVLKLSDTISGHSRWLNSVACVASLDQITKIEELSFVVKVIPMVSQAMFTEEESSYKYKTGKQSLLEGQTDWLEGKVFESEGLTGKGVRICIIDAGFPGVDYSKTFSHIRKEKKIIATWDFHKNKADVYKFNTHGSTVLSCIAGINKEGTKIGLATDAEFLLARTERLMVEGLSEEEDWLMAVEWADKNGADIINSSLGYTTSLYFKEDMDGQTALITRAGNIAAHKGILVVNAAGNEGDGYWKYVGAPADADSVLTVGGINPWTGVHTAFSSYGPTADKRMKPNVSAFGHVMAYGHKSGIHETQGTSFASPLIAGFAACVLQHDTTLTVMQLFEKIEKASNLYPYYDYAHGFGVPLASHIVLKEEEKVTPTFTLKIIGDSIFAVITDDAFQMNDEVVINYHSQFLHRQPPENSHVDDNFISDDSHIKQTQPNYVYWHIEENDGVLEEYSVVAPLEKEVVGLSIGFNEGSTFRMWYKGYSAEIVMISEVKEEVEIDNADEMEVEGE